MSFPILLEIPNIPPRFDDSLGTLTVLIVILMAGIYCTEMIQSKISKGKRSMGWSSEETRHKLSGAFPGGVTQDVLNYPNELWQWVWNVVYQGTSLETQSPKFFVGGSHIGTPCLAVIKIPDSQEESRCLA